nr:uncharacterized protein LOC109183051 [Ipomoea batatas]
MNMFTLLAINNVTNIKATTTLVETNVGRKGANGPIKTNEDGTKPPQASQGGNYPLRNDSRNDFEESGKKLSNVQAKEKSASCDPKVDEKVSKKKEPKVKVAIPNGEMPKFSLYLKGHLKHKKKLDDVSRVVLNEECFMVLHKSCPPKIGEPGTSINVMSLYVADKLFLPPLTPTMMSIQFVDGSIKYTKGTVDNIGRPPPLLQASNAVSPYAQTGKLQSAVQEGRKVTVAVSHSRAPGRRLVISARTPLAVASARSPVHVAVASPIPALQDSRSPSPSLTPGLQVGSTRKAVALAYGKRCEVNVSILEKLGVHWGDKRRSINEYKPLFPAIDFSLATKLNDVKSCKGTAFWMAPEVSCDFLQ